MQSLTKIFKTIVNVAKHSFEIISCTVIGVGVGVMVKWETEKIQQIYSVLILILLLMGFFKTLAKPKEAINSNTQESVKTTQDNLDLVEFLISKQKPLQILELSQNPTQEGEELGEIFLNQMKGGKKRMEKFINFWKNVWGNKFTILNILFNAFCVGTCEYLYFADYFLRFNWVSESQEVLNIVLPIIGILYLVLDVFTTITKYGWENLEELNIRYAEKALEKASRLTKEQKKVIKDNLNELKTRFSNVSNELNKVNGIIRSFEILRQLGNKIEISNEKVIAYNEAISKQPSLNAEYEGIKQQINALKETLK